MKKITGTENYTVRSFMTRHLGFRGAELQVYALVYSFSRGGGSFAAPRTYAAAVTGYSVRSVSRAFDSLVNRGFLTRVKVSADTFPIYGINFEHLDKILEEKGAYRELVKEKPESGTASENGKKQNAGRENVTPPVSKCHTPLDKVAHNNQEYNQELITSSTSSTERATHATRKEEKISDFSKHVKDVKMIKIKRVDGYHFTYYFSNEQYNHLIRLVGPLMLYEYIDRLDRYVYEYRDRMPHSPYKTILEWIGEDFSTVE